MLRRITLFLVLGTFALVAAGADSCSTDQGNEDKKSSTGSGGSSSSGDKSEKNPCGTTATEDCNPTVSKNRTVRVDALIWKIKNVETTKTLGDQEFGLGAKADGTFLVVTVAVHSVKNESATLTDNVFAVETAEGNKYDSDSEGTIAAVGAGSDPFFLEDIGPDSDHTGKVVFDLPDKALIQPLKMRFNELGFGETHAYIRLGTLG